MSRTLRQPRPHALVVGILLWLATVPAGAQDGPVAAMFGSDQKRHEALASSFLVTELPPTGAPAVRVYLSAGDLQRAFDNPAFRPDAAIVPTNTDLLLTAPEPGTQQVLVDRVRKHPDVLRDLEEQLLARRNTSSPASAGASGVLQIATDTLVVQLPRQASGRPADAPFPGMTCLIATDFAKGGALDRRELFAQGRLRKGIAACLAALDAAGVRSLVLPLMGAASSEPQVRDAFYEGQRVLRQCRLINATAGIALGIHDFAESRRSLREIGVVQWDEEILGMFSAPKGRGLDQSAQQAYRIYAEQIAQAFRRGLAGEPTTANDVQGTCAGVLDVP